MGNAAAAHGALAAGVNLICGYPGTPSSELVEVASAFVKDAVLSGRLAAEDAPHVEWSTNEKVALEVAYGASMAGARALATMKQVGLNVAADAFMSVATLGVKGGLVLYVADDPGPISSQNEQDTRHFAQFAKIPLLDAATPEDLYYLMLRAFELSERHRIAVIVRASTRLCHGSAPVPVLENYAPHPISGFKRDPDFDWVAFPPRAYQSHLAMPEKLDGVLADPDFSELSYLVPADNTPSQLGIVTGGISWAYLLDALADNGLTGKFDLMRVVAHFPFLDDMAADFLNSHEQILVFEELEPTIERELQRVAGSRQIIARIFGKLSGHCSIAGENSVSSIGRELCVFLTEMGQGTGSCPLPESPLEESDEQIQDTVPPLEPLPTFDDLLLARPPVLCAGCPHRASYYAVKKALRGKKATYSGDIGCYTLGNVPPLNMVDTTVCMGAGHTIPQGMYWAEPDAPHLGFVGDSTFFHGSMTGVANAVYNQTPITMVVLDNSLTAMTGSQPHPGTGMRMSYDASAEDAQQAIPIAQLIEALGVKQVREVDPFDLENAIATVQEIVGLKEVSALVFRAPCINIGTRKKAPQVLTHVCTGCSVCNNSIGCPALTLDDEASLMRVNEELCFGCDLCTQICPYGALESSGDQS